MTVKWQPSAAIPLLQLRARLLADIRDFFKDFYALEVETPVIERAAVTDPHIQSFHLPSNRFLRTSPEMAMKRLLTSGSGDIYQIAKVFRQQEIGRLHNPEFTMLEWYRIDWDYRRLMDETNQLLHRLCASYRNLPDSSYVDCIEIFKDSYGIDLLSSQRDTRLLQLANDMGLQDCSEIDAAFDFLWNSIVCRQFTADCLTFVYRYPDIQPLQARTDSNGVVQRFEVYWRDVELVNGYSELLDAAECRRRFEQDNAQRKRQQQQPMPMSEALIAAMEHGLPQCAGAALGIDRLLMCLSGEQDIAATLAFAWDNA